jgi:hypothetical protein
MIAYRCQYEPHNTEVTRMVLSSEFGALKLIEGAQWSGSGLCHARRSAIVPEGSKDVPRRRRAFLRFWPWKLAPSSSSGCIRAGQTSWLSCGLRDDASAPAWKSQGVDGSLLIEKPFAPAQLAAAVSQLLERAV